MGIFMLKCGNVDRGRWRVGGRGRQSGGARNVQRERNRNRQPERQPEIKRNSEEERERQIGILTVTGGPHWRKEI